MRDTINEIRLPCTTRLSTSRPKRSVPSGCSQSPRSIQTGGVNFWGMSPSVGLWGAREAADTAVETNAARTMPGEQGGCRPPAPLGGPWGWGAVWDDHEAD